MSKRGILVLLMLLLGAVSFSGCQKMTDDGTSTDEVGQKKDTGSGKAGKDEKVNLNHTPEFKTTRVHGQSFLTSPQSCFRCHSKDQPTTTIGNKQFRNCSSCHQGFPHKSGFKQQHPIAFFAGGSKCMSCHAERTDGSVRGVPSCTSCHPGYPHQKGYDSPDIHGSAYLGNPNSCAICHKAETHTVAGREVSSCNTCHERIPHPAGFTAGAVHGVAYQSNPTGCVDCHRDRTGTPTQGRVKNCSDCHQGFPHISGFSKPEIHGKAYFANSGACWSCHGFTNAAGVSGKRGVVAPDCTKCHASFPHQKDFSEREVHGGAWFKDSSQCQRCHSEAPPTEARPVPNCSSCHESFPHKGFDAPKVHGGAFLKDRSSCAGCHANGSAPTCGDCHLAMPHTGGFDQGKVHGKAFQQDKNSCAGCHEGQAPGAPIPSCNTCHEGFPHQAGFTQPDAHGNAYLQNQTSCIGCHGPTLEGQNGAVSCRSCHIQPHTPEFTSSGKHGQEFLKDQKQCLGCHDTKQPDLSRKTGKRSCAICHDSFPHRDGFSEPAVHGSAYFSNPSDCASCHGQNGQGKGSAPGCLDCHNFPHPAKWGEPSAHGTAFVKEKKPNNPSWKEPLSSCRECHYKKSKFRERHPERFIACDSCHHFHLEDGYSNSVPIGMNSHKYFARQPGKSCTACHAEFKKHMPRQKDKGCYNSGCHAGKIFSIEWRDAEVELGPKQP